MMSDSMQFNVGNSQLYKAGDMAGQNVETRLQYEALAGQRNSHFDLQFKYASNFLLDFM